MYYSPKKLNVSTKLKWKDFTKYGTPDELWHILLDGEFTGWNVRNTAYNYSIINHRALPYGMFRAWTPMVVNYHSSTSHLEADYAAEVIFTNEFEKWCYALNHEYYKQSHEMNKYYA